MTNIKILIAAHKPFKVPEGKYFVPVHVGRKIATSLSKDGKINEADYQWLLKNAVGDETGENISDRNRFYSECTALYWAWKNYERLGNPEYVGLMHYRRHFIFNDGYFVSKSKNKWENALSFINEDFMDDDYIRNIGLNDENIEHNCKNYDFVVVKDTKLDLIDGRNLREDYANTIPGVKVKDFDLMVDIVKSDYPEYTQVLNEKLDGYAKNPYQMFIMKKEMFFEYCEFLFDVLFKIENKMNFDEYSVNGKRTLGYLAEDLFTFFVWKKEVEGFNILKLGVTQVTFPCEEEELKNLYKQGCPSYFEYLKTKLKSLVLKGKEKQSNKERYQSIRQQRKIYKKLAKRVKNGKG